MRDIGEGLMSLPRRVRRLGDLLGKSLLSDKPIRLMFAFTLKLHEGQCHKSEAEYLTCYFHISLPGLI